MRALYNQSTNKVLAACFGKVARKIKLLVYETTRGWHIKTYGLFLAA